MENKDIREQIDKVRNFNQYINENRNIQEKKIWKNIFEYNGNAYRLQSWKYIYRFSDGSSEFATVNKEDANGVAGTGVAGIVIEIDKIEWLDSITSFDDDFIKEKEITNERRILKEKDKYNLLKSLPMNISRKRFDNIVINKIIKNL